MFKSILASLAGLIVIGSGVFNVGAADLDPKLQAKIDEQTKQVQSWAKDPAIVDAVKARNANTPAEYKEMNQEKWKALPITDAFVRSFSKNKTAEFLKTKKSEAVAEAFVSAADGTKVAFLGKTSNWSHLGKPKHDDPMKGKTWQGAIEVDESSGIKQIQIAVPVLDGDKPIGSLTLGLNVAALEN